MDNLTDEQYKTIRFRETTHYRLKQLSARLVYENQIKRAGMEGAVRWLLDEFERNATHRIPTAQK